MCIVRGFGNDSMRRDVAVECDVTGAEVVDERGEVCEISVDLNETVHVGCLL